MPVRELHATSRQLFRTLFINLSVLPCSLLISGEQDKAKTNYDYIAWKAIVSRAQCEKRVVPLQVFTFNRCYLRVDELLHLNYLLYMKQSHQETVVVILENDTPVIMARMNGKMTYYKLQEMGYADHVEFLEADVVQK